MLIGFAAETENLMEEARRKMNTKKCDMVVANLVSAKGLGFESDRNEVDILSRSGQIVHAGPADKNEIAERILDEVGDATLEPASGRRDGMTPGQIRDYLKFYRDLGIETIYRGAAAYSAATAIC